ncbi:MAG: HEAT repeat domain-containing protein [Nitrospira sp.]|nr:HEAT repeat domain-containing protein [Nitrospira sp.]MCP9462786.1 HEAT repeat domain-containing protein [Nitrospira sp.]MCP9475835.1 HEAT repeat domain-containing protein [Nitrospira sp.]
MKQNLTNHPADEPAGAPNDAASSDFPVGDEGSDGPSVDPVDPMDLREPSVGEDVVGAEEVAGLEEERVKDEIDIQIDLLGDPDWVVRREAVVTLGEMGDERCVEPLAKALRDGDWQVREAAVEAIAQVGSPAVELLIKLLRDWDIRKYAILALGKIRDERVLDPLMLQLRSDEFKDDAIQALVELGEPAVARLIGALRDKDENVRKSAVLALGRIKSAAAIDPLIDMTKDPDWFIRLTAAAALESIGDERGREAIKPLLKDSDMVVRMRVERILAKWKKQPVSPSGTA